MTLVIKAQLVMSHFYSDNGNCSHIRIHLIAKNLLLRNIISHLQKQQLCLWLNTEKKHGSAYFKCQEMLE